MKKNYSIGLDIGTTSVGWSVVDDATFKIIKKGNKRRSMWGVRLFDSANSANDRRNARSTRRRYNRRRQRIKYLQEIFEQEMNKIDTDFYQKLSDTKYHKDDQNNLKIGLKDYDKVHVFGNNSRSLGMKEYPTIYHIRNKVMNSNCAEDIRLVYLAIHHIIKYRGNFLYTNDNFNVNKLDIGGKLKDIFVEIEALCKEINFNIDDFPDYIYSELEIILFNNSTIDKKKLLKNALISYFSKPFVDEFIKMILGNTFELSKLFSMDFNDNLNMSFDSDDYEEKCIDYEKIIGDKISIVLLCKELYDMLFLKKIFGNSNQTNLSSVMIEKYNKHHCDLVKLKEIMRYDKKAYKLFFKDVNKGRSNEKYVYIHYI